MEQLKQINKTEPDNEIIRKILNGEKQLFELIMRKYNQRLFRIGISMLKDEDEVEDIMQETYIRAYEHLNDFEYRASFSTWLIRILINIALARKEHLKKFDSAGFHENEDGEKYNKINSEKSDMKTPEGYSINNELRILLESAIEKLPEKYRTIFTMREIEKMSVAETCACLKLTESNVKVRLNRAKEMLRENIINNYGDVEVYQFMGERCDRMVNNVMGKLGIIN